MPAVYRSCGYGEWEDELLALHDRLWATQPDQVLALMSTMFKEHSDVHDLVCYFLRRVGRRRPKKDALWKVILQEFLKWKQQKGDNLPKFV